MKFKVGGKLLAGFGAVVCLTLAVGITGVLQIRIIVADDTFLFEKATKPLVNLITIAENFQRVRLQMRTVIMATDEASLSKAESEIAGLRMEIDEASASFETTIISDKGREYFEAY